MSAPSVLPRGFSLQDAAMYVAELAAAGLVLPDDSLDESEYSPSELWCYIFHLWGGRRQYDPVFSQMSSPRGEFDSDRARDVVRATMARHAGSSPVDLGRKTLFAFVRECI